MDNNDELKEFTKSLGLFILHQKQRDPLIMGAALMKVAVELYTHNLNNDEIYNLLDVVAKSVPEIREKTFGLNIHETMH